MQLLLPQAAQWEGRSQGLVVLRPFGWWVYMYIGTPLSREISISGHLSRQHANVKTGSGDFKIDLHSYS